MIVTRMTPFRHFLHRGFPQLQARQTNKATLHRESAILSWDRRWLDGKLYTEGVVETAQK